MGWNMYKDGNARYDMRIKHQLSVEAVATLIADVTSLNGKKETTISDDSGDYTEFITKESEWSKKAIDERIRDKLFTEGLNSISSEHGYLVEYYGEEEAKQRIEVAKNVVADKYNIDELREEHGFEPKFRERGGSRGNVNVKRHIRRTQKGKPTTVRNHKRRKPKRGGL